MFEIGLQAAGDTVIWEHVRKKNAVIISKDEDFVDRWLLSEAPVALNLGKERQLFKRGIAEVV